ncbi:MAG: (Fe-S)-binding protein [Gemmatimonadaceae bacterium]
MSERVALFVPCFVDQLYPGVAVAALRVLERLGVQVVVRDGAVCCGQPMANAGFVHEAEPVLARWVRTFGDVRRVVVLSGSCAAHVRAHAPALAQDGQRVAERTVEFTEYLHDVIGVDALAPLGATFPRRVAIHVGCHGLRALELARASELQRPPRSKVQAVLEAVGGISFAPLRRPDECCGFGGSFSVSEAAVSTKMGRDRLRDVQESGAEALVSTDMSCVMHLRGVSDQAPTPMALLHVAEVLATGLA